MLEQFKSNDSFIDLFDEFYCAKQSEDESSRDFGVRLEGLAQRANDTLDDDEKMPEKLKKRLLLAQFKSGLRKSIREQMKILSPANFSEAVKVAERIENSSEPNAPNVNIIAARPQENSDMAHLLRSTTDGYYKSLELVSQQLQALNARMDKEQQGAPYPMNQPSFSNQNNYDHRQAPTCNYCHKIGHKAPECRKRLRDRGQNQTHYQQYGARRGQFGNDRQNLN